MAVNGQVLKEATFSLLDKGSQSESAQDARWPEIQG